MSIHTCAIKPLKTIEKKGRGHKAHTRTHTYIYRGRCYAMHEEPAPNARSINTLTSTLSAMRTSLTTVFRIPPAPRSSLYPR